MHFQFDYLRSVTAYNIIFPAVIWYTIKHLFCEEPDLYYFEAIKLTSEALSKFT